MAKSSRCFERESVNRASVEYFLHDEWFGNIPKNTSTPVIESKSTLPCAANRSGNNN